MTPSASCLISNFASPFHAPSSPQESIVEDSPFATRADTMRWRKPAQEQARSRNAKLSGRHVMRAIILGSLTIAGLVACAPGVAQAQTAPPIKPGLWQVHSEREVDGKKVQMPDMSERFKDMPPETRKK